jgi:hypothetical protein
MPQARLWSLEDPFLYEVEAVLEGAEGAADKVSTYFGMRKISVVDLPGTEHRYVALNNEPSLNPNAYPMTDGILFPSAVTVRANGRSAGRFELDDDPADHRGILSWHEQPKDGKLREAGSYGQMLKVGIPRGALDTAAKEGVVVIRLEVDEALPGGLAIYGARFGRYPLDPTLLLTLR